MDSWDVVMLVLGTVAAGVFGVTAGMQLARVSRAGGPDIVWRGKRVPEARLEAVGGFCIAAFFALGAVGRLVRDNPSYPVISIVAIGFMAAAFVLFLVRSRRIGGRPAPQK